MVVGVGQAPDGVYRPAADLSRVAVAAALQSRLERAHRQRRVGGDAFGQRSRVSHQVGMRCHPSDQADSQGFRRVNDIAGEQQLGGLFGADQRGQSVEAANIAS